jgi:hypothetical protein
MSFSFLKTFAPPTAAVGQKNFLISAYLQPLQRADRTLAWQENLNLPQKHPNRQGNQFHKVFLEISVPGRRKLLARAANDTG